MASRTRARCRWVQAARRRRLCTACSAHAKGACAACAHASSAPHHALSPLRPMQTWSCYCLAGAAGPLGRRQVNAHGHAGAAQVHGRPDRCRAGGRHACGRQLYPPHSLRAPVRQLCAGHGHARGAVPVLRGGAQRQCVAASMACMQSSVKGVLRLACLPAAAACTRAIACCCLPPQVMQFYAGMVLPRDWSTSRRAARVEEVLQDMVRWAWGGVPGAWQTVQRCES